MILAENNYLLLRGAGESGLLDIAVLLCLSTNSSNTDLAGFRSGLTRDLTLLPFRPSSTLSEVVCTFIVHGCGLLGFSHF